MAWTPPSKSLHTVSDQPEHQMAYFCVVWCCCNKQIWLQKKSSEKLKCVVMWLNMCCFIIERHQIRVWAVKVGFDPRQIAHTVTYMDISTSSCSLKYQLSFKARVVSVGWVGSKWLDSECKKVTYLDISPVSPLWENTYIYGLYGVYIRRRKSHIRFRPTLNIHPATLKIKKSLPFLYSHATKAFHGASKC